MANAAVDKGCESLFTAFVELFVAILLLLSAAISVITSKLIKKFQLAHPCQYLDLPHHQHPQLQPLLDEQQISSAASLSERVVHVSDACGEEATATAAAVACEGCVLRMKQSEVEAVAEGSVEENENNISNSSMVWYDRRSTGVLHSVMIKGGGFSGDRCVKRKLAKVFVEEFSSEFEAPEEEGLCFDDSNNPTATTTTTTTTKEEASNVSALYSELEEERNASAIAANEAMAMITRLQEEKAAVQMEARQYQRMVEEKAVYDHEAISLLKEILVKREEEKFALEREVEMYRMRMMNDSVEKWLEEYVEETGDVVRYGADVDADVYGDGDGDDDVEERRYDTADEELSPVESSKNLLETFEMALTKSVGSSDEERAVGCSREMEGGDLMRRETKVEDVRELTLRLQALEDDRRLLKEALDSVKSEKGERRVLHEIAHHLRELLYGGELELAAASSKKRRRSCTGKSLMR